MGDFGTSQLQQTETAQMSQEEEQRRQEEIRKQRSAQQGDVLRMGLSFDVGYVALPLLTRDESVRMTCEKDAWDKIQGNVSYLREHAPTGAAIGSPVQQEPAEDDKTRKEREKKLAKINKNGIVKAEHGSVVLQEKVSASQVSRKAIEKQIEKDRKKGIDEKTLEKEYVKQNLIRAFSNNIRTNKLGQTIAEDKEKELYNEAFKNNMEGHMSGVVQWIYQVDLNPDVMLTDTYVRNHSSELFQTADRLQAFFDYYDQIKKGDEKWERGFLDDAVIVGERGKEILDIKAKQAKNFRELLTDKFKAVLSVDIETGRFLAAGESYIYKAKFESYDDEKKENLQNQREDEQKCYQRMVEDDLGKVSVNRDLAKGNQELRKVFEEHTKNAERFAKLSEMLNSDNKYLQQCGELTESIRAQVERDKESFNKVYEDLEKCLQLNYASKNVLAKNLQGIVEQKRKELQGERRQLNERLNSFEEPIRFMVEGGKISSPTTVDTLVKAGYPSDALLERAYRSKGGILDQSNEILNELEVRQKEDGTEESKNEYEERLLKKSSIVTQGKSIGELTPQERTDALKEVRSTIRSKAVEPLFGRGKTGGVVRQLVEKESCFDFNKYYASTMEIFVYQTIHAGQKLSRDNNGSSFNVVDMSESGKRQYERTGSAETAFTYHPVDVRSVVTKKEHGKLEKVSDKVFVGDGMAQATSDYVNYISVSRMYEQDDVMSYFVRMKELIGDAKVFEEKDKNGNIDEKETNRNFTASLLQDYNNHYTANPLFGVPEINDNTDLFSGAANKKDQRDVFTMIASSLMDIAKKDTTGENYQQKDKEGNIVKEGVTMQEALVTYRKMADRVAGKLEKREAEKKEKEVKEQKPTAKKTAEAAKEYVEERNRKKTAKETAEAAKEYVEKNKKEKAAKKAAEEAKKQAPEEKKAEETV